MENSELVGELLQELTKDVNRLQQSVNKLSGQAPPDYRGRIDELTQVILALQKQVSSTATGSDQNPVLERLTRLEQSIRQRPEYKMSRYVQYGGYVFGLLVILLAGMSWLALSWRSERNAFEISDWKWRNLRQVDPVYVRHIDSAYVVSSQANGGKDWAEQQQWIIQQEQADATRETAHQAAEQAKAMNAQADRLEGKTLPKGKKKARP